MGSTRHRQNMVSRGKGGGWPWLVPYRRRRLVQTERQVLTKWQYQVK